MMRLRVFRPPPGVLNITKAFLFLPIQLHRSFSPVIITRSATIHRRPAPYPRSDPISIQQEVPPASGQHHIPEEEPEKPRAGRGFLSLFFLVASPITFAYQFPTHALPPAPDPPHLQHLSETPLTAGIWLSSPWQSFQLMMFRLRRGEYVLPLRKHFAFTPLNYIGLSSEPKNLLSLASGNGGAPEKWRWWTWGTYMFAHGGLFHFVFCYAAMNSLVPMIAARYGTARTVALFAGGGTGSAALCCLTESYRHGQDVKDGKAIQLVKHEQIKPDNTRLTVNQLAPAPGCRSVFASSIGSSAGLMAMITTAAVAMPQTKWGILFLPFSTGARPMLGALVAWDLAGVLGYAPDMGVGHLGHLCGDLVGLLMYALWLRRLPVSRLMAWKRKREGYW